MIREADATARPAAPVPGTAEYDAEIALAYKGETSVRGFWPGKFIKPYQLMPKNRLKTQRRSIRPSLGPDARESRELDPFYQLEIDPLDECMNSSLLSHFVTDMGKIQRRANTRLTWKNQRRMGKAIRRAKMMGLIPVLSKRPLPLIGMRY